MTISGSLATAGAACGSPIVLVTKCDTVPLDENTASGPKVRLRIKVRSGRGHHATCNIRSYDLKILAYSMHYIYIMHSIYALIYI